MLISSQISLFLALFISQVVAQGDNDVKRGKFPYMAFIYYPDETGSEIPNNRFFRSAILIRLNWLISAAVDNTFLDKAFVGFPKKTLLARIGAVTIDNKITFNEDEGEQESEIIKIVRPQIHFLEKWWETDMTLLKTLAPFKETTAVSPVVLPANTDFAGKNCSILVFAKKVGNLTEDKVLMNLVVDTTIPDDICKLTLKTSKMFCADKSEANKNLIYEPGFCQGNGGGPIICGGEVMGTQTYIDNSCSTPYLYQMLSAWENFITCGTEEKCDQESCSRLCTISDKDQPLNQDELLLPATSNLINEIDSTSGPSNVSYVVEVFSHSSEETEASNTGEDITTTENSTTVQVDPITNETETTLTESSTVEQTTLPVTEQIKVTTESVIQTMTTEGRRKLNPDSENEREQERKPVTRNLKKQKRKSSAMNVIAIPVIQYLLITAIVTLATQCH